MVGAINIDLAAQSFVSGAISVEIQNFVDVKGTTNNDTIKGDAGDNVFFGSAGSDVYDGREGAGDTINYTGLGGADAEGAGRSRKINRRHRHHRKHGENRR